MTNNILKKYPYKHKISNIVKNKNKPFWLISRGSIKNKSKSKKDNDVIIFSHSDT